MSGTLAGMTAKATPAKATQQTQPTPDDQADQADQVQDQSGSLTADLMTVLRHLVSNQQWGGHHGARAECEDALNRLMDSTK